jgi:hypothetical protein
MKKYIRKINKISTHSYSVNLPKEIIRKYGYREKQRLVLTDKGRGRIEIRDYRS